MEKIIYIVGTDKDINKIESYIPQLQQRGFSVKIEPLHRISEDWNLLINADSVIFCISSTTPEEIFNLSLGRVSSKKTSINIFIEPTQLTARQKQCIGKNKSIFLSLISQDLAEEITDLLNSNLNEPFLQPNNTKEKIHNQNVNSSQNQYDAQGNIILPVYEEPKKNYTGLIIGIIVVALVIAGVWFYLYKAGYFGHQQDFYADAPVEEEMVQDKSSTTTINGIRVHWHDASEAQKNLITQTLLNMVDVEGGDYYMGTNSADAYADEKPMHTAHVNSFKINKFEVTQALWTAVMGYNPSKFKGDNLPVENVSWEQCIDFIAKLNKLTGLQFRMPTEEEWEYAARGGRKSDYYVYSGNNNAGFVGWTAENSGNKTHAVGQKSPNELGLYDMTGNVWEWTSDKWSPDYNSARTGENYVRRGGSAMRPAKFARLTYRNRGDKADNGNLYGMRLAM